MTNPDDRREIRNAGAIGLLVALLAFLACCVGCEKQNDSSLRQDVETLWKEHDLDRKTTFERITAIEQQLKQPTPVLPAPADEKKLAAIEKDIAELKKDAKYVGQLGERLLELSKGVLQLSDKFSRVLDILEAWKQRLTALEKKSHEHKECKK